MWGVCVAHRRTVQDSLSEIAGQRNLETLDVVTGHKKLDLESYDHWRATSNEAHWHPWRTG